MNDLEKALTDQTNVALDFYLEDTSTQDVRAHIEEIIAKATVLTDAGKLKAKIQALLQEVE